MPDDVNPSMKICFIAPKAYPLFNPQVEEVFGGAEVDLYFLATELAKDKSFQVFFMVADYGQPEQEIRENVTLVKGVNFRKNALVGARQIWKVCRTIPADIYFAKTVSLGIPLISFFCQLRRKYFIFRTANDQECNGVYVQKHPILARFYLQAIRNAAAVFTQNITDQENLYKTTGVHSFAISNGKRLQPVSFENRKAILWVGRSDAIKRPDLFVKLAQELPNYPFTMICQKATYDVGYEELLSQASQVRNLQFIKRVPFQEIDRYFAQAAVFVNTSDSEGFPNTFIQACQCGTPILSLRVNPDDFLNRYQCGMCAEGDWERFVSQFQQLQDPEMAKSYGENGRKYAEEHHDIRKIIEQYKTIFQSLMDKKQERNRP